MQQNLPLLNQPPNWLLTALAEYGVREIPGIHASPRILQYHATTTLRATSDEVPWCSAFVNWCMRECGIKGTDSAAARSWLAWGTPLQLPKLGCVVVFSSARGADAGHVGFLQRSEQHWTYVLGGNQGNAVSLSPYETRSVLGFRWPS